MATTTLTFTRDSSSDIKLFYTRDISNDIITSSVIGEVNVGSTVNYSVSKDGYTTVTGSEVCTINRTINCTLEKSVRTITATIISQPSSLDGLTINGTNYPMTVNTPLTVSIEIGTDVVLEPYTTYPLACYISETSNESYISMNSFDMYSKRSFKMPNEDLSFKFYSNGDPI